MSTTRINVLNSDSNILYINNITNNGVNIASGGGITTIGSSTAATISSTGILTINNTTVSTSSSTGALKILGGIGISGNIYGGSELVLSNNNLGVQLNSSNSPLITRNWDTFTSGAYTGIGKWGVFMEAGILTAGIAQNNVFAAFQVASYNYDSTFNTLLTTNVNGNTNLPVNISSTSTTTGTLTIAGGIGLSGNIFSGGTLNNTNSANLATSSGTTTIGSSTAATISSTGILTINNTTASSSISTGALIVTGGVGISKSLYVGGPLDINSNKSGTPSTTGQYFRLSASTFTDSNTSISGIAANMVFNSIAAPTLNATNTSVTTTNAVTLYIAGNPIASTNETITNSYGFWNAGNERINGHLNVNGGVKINLQNQVNGGSNNGIFFYNDIYTNWGLYFATSGVGHSLNDATACAAPDFTDYAIRMRCQTDANQGFIWENATETLLMSMNAVTGNINAVGSLSLLGGADQIIIKAPSSTFGSSIILDANTNISGKKYRIFSTGTSASEGANKLIFQNITDSTYPFVLTPTGNMMGYSGSATTSYLLDVNGTSRIAGIMSLTSNTSSTSTSTGTLIVTGGLGISGNIFSGGTLNNTNSVNLATSSGTTTIGASTQVTISNTGVLTINNTTTSSSISTGALIVTGGIGISNTTDAVSASNGGAFTSAGGLAIAKTGYFGGAIHLNYTSISSGAGVIKISPQTNGTESSINFYQNTTEGGAFWVIGHNSGGAGSNVFSIYNSTFNGNVLTIDSTGKINILSGNTSTSTSTGALVITGGIGIGGALYVGNNINGNGEFSLTNNSLGVQLSGSNSPLITRNLNTFATGTYTGIGSWGLFMEAAALTLGIPSASIQSIGKINFNTYNANSSINSTLMTVNVNGNINIPGTTSSTSNSTGILTIAGGIGITNTTDAVSTTNGGTFTSAGGLAVAKSAYIGTSLTVASKNITPNSEDIIQQVSFSGANNQSSAANVTGLLFTTSVTRSFIIQITVVISATNSLYAQFQLDGIYNGTSWYFASNYLGDATLVTFTITNGGQIQYTSGNYTGFSSFTMKFKAQTITI